MQDTRSEALEQFVTDSQAAADRLRKREHERQEREHERERREHDEKVELERRSHEKAVERERRAREARVVREHEMEMTRLRGDNAAATAGQAIAPAVHAKSLRLPEFKEKTNQIDA